MTKLIAAAVAFLAIAAPATAQPVSKRAAHVAVHRWWKDPQQPTVRWCRVKTDGTICALRVKPVYLASEPGFVLHCEETVWVSRTRGRLRVAFLNATLRGTIPLN